MNKTEALPRVRMQTSEGDLLIELYSEQSPKTVANFLQYVESGHYEGTVFHRVIEGFMIQGGGYDESFKERPAREPVENESRNGVSNSRGTLSMARQSHPDSASSQFFICHGRQPSLDGNYAAFGKLVSGLDVLDRIADVPCVMMPGGVDQVPSKPREKVVIRGIQIVAAGDPEGAAPSDS